MKIAILSNEYPPYVYGGAGVHVEYLSRELANLSDRNSVKVLCFGDQEEHSSVQVRGITPPVKLPSHDSRIDKISDPLLRDLMMAITLKDVDIVHCHTWYTHFAGCLAKQLLEVPLVLTTHSLEPHRPWKLEQLGPAYRVSSWLEKTAYENADGVIAVSRAMREDVHDLYGVPMDRIRVIHNGIDLDQYENNPDLSILDARGIDRDEPFILFVGRITRQKGIIHLINAIQYLKPGIQIVLCAGAPDTEEIGREMEEKVRLARTRTSNRIVWIPEFVSKEEAIGLYSLASVFVCPSVYEPFGIINLEAMACRTPVVASAVGGIKEVVVHEKTGLLVAFDPVSEKNFEPRDPEQFSKDLASSVNSLLSSPERRKSMSEEGRKRVENHFSWRSIARQTSEFYEEVLSRAKSSG
jgi:alpha-maltose-1-phosphate synthase